MIEGNTVPDRHGDVDNGMRERAKALRELNQIKPLAYHLIMVQTIISPLHNTRQDYVCRK